MAAFSLKSRRVERHKPPGWWRLTWLAFIEEARWPHSRGRFTHGSLLLTEEILPHWMDVFLSPRKWEQSFYQLVDQRYISTSFVSWNVSIFTSITNRWPQAVVSAETPGSVCIYSHCMPGWLYILSLLPLTPPARVCTSLPPQCPASSGGDRSLDQWQAWYTVSTLEIEWTKWNVLGYLYPKIFLEIPTLSLIIFVAGKAFVTGAPNSNTSVRPHTTPPSLHNLTYIYAIL